MCRTSRPVSIRRCPTSSASSPSCCGAGARTANWSAGSTRISARWWRPPGCALDRVPDDPTLKMTALSIAGFGIFGSLPVFWTLPTAFLSGAAAAGGIALINSIGNLAGFAGPYRHGSTQGPDRQLHRGGLLSLAAAGYIAMIIVLVIGHDHSLERRLEPARLDLHDPDSADGRSRTGSAADMTTTPQRRPPRATRCAEGNSGKW